MKLINQILTMITLTSLVSTLMAMENTRQNTETTGATQKTVKVKISSVNLDELSVNLDELTELKKKEPNTKDKRSWLNKLTLGFFDSNGSKNDSKKKDIDIFIKDDKKEKSKLQKTEEPDREDLY
jgi:hypothetical protein